MLIKLTNCIANKAYRLYDISTSSRLLLSERISSSPIASSMGSNFLILTLNSKIHEQSMKTNYFISSYHIQQLPRTYCVVLKKLLIFCLLSSQYNIIIFLEIRFSEFFNLTQSCSISNYKQNLNNNTISICVNSTCQ